MKILVDHDIEGQAVLLWGAVSAQGWLELIEADLVMFSDVGIPPSTSDRMVWRFVQANGMILLTGNRNMKGQDSLEQTLREENTADSLPIVTIGRVNRLENRAYRNRCASRLIEILVDIETHRGAARVFIP
jgi:hypothetical protein